MKPNGADPAWFIEVEVTVSFFSAMENQYMKFPEYPAYNFIQYFKKK